MSEPHQFKNKAIVCPHCSGTGYKIPPKATSGAICATCNGRGDVAVFADKQGAVWFAEIPFEHRGPKESINFEVAFACLDELKKLKKE